MIDGVIVRHFCW